MKKLLVLFALLASVAAFAQNNIMFTAAWPYTEGAPTFVPGGKGSRFAVDVINKRVYVQATSSTWMLYGNTLQETTGCTAPAYVPAGYQSLFVVNACDSLYYYISGSWHHLNPPGITGSGVNKQVTFWTGSQTQSGDTKFTFDGSTDRLLIGTTSASGRTVTIYNDVFLEKDATSLMSGIETERHGFTFREGGVGDSDNTIDITKGANVEGTASSPLFRSKNGIIRQQGLTFDDGKFGFYDNGTVSSGSTFTPSYKLRYDPTFSLWTANNLLVSRDFWATSAVRVYKDAQGYALFSNEFDTSRNNIQIWSQGIGSVDNGIFLNRGAMVSGSTTPSYKSTNSIVMPATFEIRGNYFMFTAKDTTPTGVTYTPDTLLRINIETALAEFYHNIRVKNMNGGTPTGIVTADVDGDFKRLAIGTGFTISGDTLYAAGGGGGGGSDGAPHTIQDNGTDMTQRPNLNFIGFTLTDDAGNDATDVEPIHQELSISNDTVFLTSGGFVVLPEGGGGGSCCPIRATYAEWDSARTACNLPVNTLIVITDRADLGIQLTTTDDTCNIGVTGVGGFLNCDFQAVGDYSGVEALTGFPYTETRGIWRESFEYITVTVSDQAGGTFAVGDEINGSPSGNPGRIIADDGAGSLTVLFTSSGDKWAVSDELDNGAGVTATVDAVGTPAIADGDVVFWNLNHYQCIDANGIDGTNPVENTSTYQLLPRDSAGMGYIEEWDNVEFDFANDWLQYRADKRGNKISLAYVSEQDLFGAGTPAVDVFQWGNQYVYGNVVNDGFFDCINSKANTVATNTLGAGCMVRNTDFKTDCYFKNNTLIGGAAIDNISIGVGAEFSENIYLPFSAVQDSYFDDGFIYNLNYFAQGATMVSCTLSGEFSRNKVDQFGKFLNITTGASCTIQNNILENGGSITGITAGASCSIRRNKVGQGATLGGSTTLGDGVQVNGNVLGASAQITGITASDNATVQSNTVGSSSILGDATIIGISSDLSGNILKSNISVGFLTLDDGVQFSEKEFGITIDVAQTLSASVVGTRAQAGFSDCAKSIDATGVTTFDCLAENNYVGIYTVTSTNATETIDEILNAPTAFPFIIKPEPGLTLTITGTAVTTPIAAGQFALTTSTITLDGDKGEYIQLEIDPFGTGYVQEVKRVILN